MSSAPGCRRLAGRVQVLCITHLPQIAAHGSTHYRIGKSVKAGRTITSVTRIGAADREEELARMIGGAAVSPAVMASAREMLATRAPTCARRGRSCRKTATRLAKAKVNRKAKAKRGAGERCNGAKVSDRDSRLPDERARLRAHGGVARAGWLRSRLPTTATPTSSSSTRAACGNAPKKNSSRVSVSFGRWASSKARGRSSR